MAQESAKKYMELLRDDKALQEKLAAATAAYAGDASDEKAVFAAVLAPIAKEAGFDFSYEDAAELAKAPVGELSDDELDQVAGGFALCFGIGVGKTDNDNAAKCVGVGLGITDNIMFT